MPTTVELQHDSTAELTASGYVINDKYRVWDPTISIPSDAVSLCLSHIGISIGAIGIGGAILKRASCDRIDRTQNRSAFVTLTWEPPSFVGTAPSTGHSVCEFDSWELKKALWKDFSATPKDLVNTAGDRYEVEITRRQLKIIVTMKQSDLNIARLADCGKINNASVTIAGVACPAYTVMLDTYKPYSVPVPGGSTVNYYGKYEFLVNMSTKYSDGTIIGWQTERANAGYNVLGTAGDLSTRKAYQNPKTKNYDQTYLDANGQATTTRNFLTFIEHPLVDMSGWGLPTTYNG